MVRGSSELDYRVDPIELRDFVRTVFLEAGVGDRHADRLADALVRADLRGVDSHGVARLETYVEKFVNGGFNTDPDITVTDVGDAAVLVDADDGPGQSATVEAMDVAKERADESGIGIAAVTNSNHFGTAAYYTERASDDDYIGMAMTNVGPDVAPFGGVSRFLGTNPVSFSIPTDLDFPITLDMATSVVAMGKIDHAEKEDAELPADWALDENGDPTTDPESVAALRPVGGPKGYGLAIVVDVLCGVLTGVGPSHTVGALYGDYEDPMRLGHFVAAIDVSRFRGVEEFKRDVGQYVDAMKAQETKEGVDEILLPGEPETRTKRENERAGIELNGDARRGVATLAERYGLSLPGAHSGEGAGNL